MKPLTAAGILLLLMVVLFTSFFQVVLDSLSSSLVLISLVVFVIAGLCFGMSRLNPKHGYAIAVVLVLKRFRIHVPRRSGERDESTALESDSEGLD